MPLLCALLLLGLPAAGSSGQAPTLFAAQAGQVIRLVDADQDGDYLDFNEVNAYATGLSANLPAVGLRGASILVVDATQSTIIELLDLNGDGDCLDAGEVRTFADLSGFVQAGSLRGIACHADGTLVTADSAAAILYRAADLNTDGDALDAGEVLPVADGLSNCAAAAFRPDGLILASVQLLAAPVRILRDRNGDGDYFDFAENISYLEDVSPGSSLSVVSDRLSFLLRPSDGRVLRLYDATNDGDALDFGEVSDWAEGWSAATAMVHDGRALYIASSTPPGRIHRVADLNADADALDFGESILVAEGLGLVSALTAQSLVAPCVAGDLNADSLVDFSDVTPFANALLGLPPAPPLCRADMNQDARLDGLDVAPFVDLLVP